MREILAERTIGAWLRTWCANRGYNCIKLNPSTHIGMPDRLILLNNGVCVFVELKTNGSRLRPMQEVWRDTLIARGFNYLLIDKVNDDVVEWLERYFDQLQFKQ